MIGTETTYNDKVRYKYQGEQIMLSCFEPVVDSKSEILILGTLPGPLSLICNEYYANPQNQIWDILYSVYDLPKDVEYVEKCRFLLTHKLALWDVLKFASREGALDSNIDNPIPNDFTNFLSKYPNIKCLVFNGATSEKIFKKHNKNIYNSLCHRKVPSSSPTPGRYVKTLNEKIDEWKNAIGLI